MIFPTTLSIIYQHLADRRERAAALGIWGAIIGVGVARPGHRRLAPRALLLGQRVLGPGAVALVSA